MVIRMVVGIGGRDREGVAMKDRDNRVEREWGRGDGAGKGRGSRNAAASDELNVRRKTLLRHEASTR